MMRFRDEIGKRENKDKQNADLVSLVARRQEGAAPDSGGVSIPCLPCVQHRGKAFRSLLCFRLPTWSDGTFHFKAHQVKTRIE